MPDREKVIHGLECCTGLGCHHGCEYLNSGCTELLKKDALSLLKEQQEKILMMNMVYGSDCKVVGELVRCKDCKHSCDILFNVDKDTKKIKTDTIKTYCKKHDCSQKLDWFCADGVRKDNTK